MYPFILTALTREKPPIHQKTKICGVFLRKRKPLGKFNYHALNVSSFKPTSRTILHKTSTKTAVKHFKLRATAETSYQFTFDDDQEKETQPIYLSSDESENTTPCSSPGSQLVNNFLDSYGGITQIIASKHEQMSASRNLIPEYLPTPPTSIISDDDDNEVFTPKIGNLTQNVPHVPNRRPHPLQLRQQLAPISDAAESPTPENRRQPALFRPYYLPSTPTTSAYPLPSISTVIERSQTWRCRHTWRTMPISQAA